MWHMFWYRGNIVDKAMLYDDGTWKKKEKKVLALQSISQTFWRIGEEVSRWEKSLWDWKGKNHCLQQNLDYFFFESSSVNKRRRVQCSETTALLIFFLPARFQPTKNLGNQDQILPARSCKHKASLFIFVFCFAGIASTRRRRKSVREQQKAGFPHFRILFYRMFLRFLFYLLNKSLFMCSLKYCLELLLA